MRRSPSSRVLGPRVRGPRARGDAQRAVEVLVHPEGGRFMPRSSARLLVLLILAACLPASAATAKVRVYGPKIISRDTPLPASCDGRSQETDTMIAADPRRSRHLVATWDQDDHKSSVVA